MTNDPRLILAREPMGRLQIIAVAVCVMLNALDGFDVLSISFASPGIAAEWGIDRAQLGLVLSMELIGMALGSVILGGFADRHGRRPTILGCLVVMATGMALAATADEIVTLSLYRLLTGFGIGGVLASTNAMTAELANDKRRNLAVAVMAGGYPIGAVLGGSVASLLLVDGNWRSIFLFGAIVTALMIPAVLAFLPESIDYLSHRRPKGALSRINKTLARMGHPMVAQLPELAPATPRTPIGQLFAPNLARTTILLTIAYFAHIMTFYFIIKWIPKIVVDMGFAAASAGGVLVWANVGGASGAMVLSLLTQRFDIKALVIGALILSFGLVTLFGQGQADLTQLALIAGIAGFCTNSAVVGLYAIFAREFPTEVRAGGTGFVIGVGRGGAALGPIVAGFLFKAGWGLSTVASLMALGSVLSVTALLLLRQRRD